MNRVFLDRPGFRSLQIESDELILVDHNERTWVCLDPEQAINLMRELMKLYPLEAMGEL